MAGAYFSSWFTKEYLFPNPIGWNPFFFGGYPQNQFYGPLLPYLAALLAQVMPISLAFKIIISLAIILTPLSFYYFSRSLELSKNKSAIAMAFMFSMLFIFTSKWTGGDFYSTFENGFVAQALSLPLFFFYFGLLVKKIETKYFVLPSVLAAAVILAHSYAAICLAIAVIAVLISKRNKKSTIYLIKHLILILLLCLFWLIPLIEESSQLNFFLIGNFAYVVEIVLISASLSFIAFFLKKENLFIPSLWVLLTGLFIFFGQEYLKTTIHFYRMTFFVMLFAPVLFFLTIQIKKFESKKVYKIAMCFILLACFATALYLVANARPIKAEGYSTAILPANLDFGEINQGRILINAPPSLQQSPHELQHLIPMTFGNISSRGLFSESSKNSRFFFNIEKEIDPSYMDWGVLTDGGLISSNPDFYYDLLPHHLSLFGITRIISPDSKFDWKVEKEYFFPYNGFDYSLYSTGAKGFFEPVAKEIKKISTNNWDQEVNSWFISEGVKSTILVEENAPDIIAKGDEEINIISSTKNFDRLVINIASEKEIPVLIKFTYFKNWKARQAGKEIKIYKASPHLMLMYAKGTVELSYEKSPFELIGGAITILTIIVLLIHFLFLLVLKKNPGSTFLKIRGLKK